MVLYVVLWADGRGQTAKKPCEGQLYVNRNRLKVDLELYIRVLSLLGSLNSHNGKIQSIV